MRVAHPLVTRAHLLLRFDQGRWLAVDNDSQSGMFVDGRRVPVVDIRDGQSINIGKPDGPRLTFALGQHQGAVGQLPPTVNAVPIITPQADPRPSPPSSAQRAGVSSPAAAGRPSAPLQRTARPDQPTQAPFKAGRPQQAGHLGQAASPRQQGQPGQRIPETVTPNAPRPADVPEQETIKVRSLRFPTKTETRPASSTSIGRAIDNDIVITDVLASRYHAYLSPSAIGTEIHDSNSINGTFVNGTRVGSAVLTEGDVVTIGNVDLVFTDGMLVRRTEAATRTGGLEVREVGFSVDGKNLLEKVSLTARPGTLTALIGGSGAGKTTLSKLIAGYTCPTSGSVTFEGHDIHAQYASLRSRIGMVPQDDVVHRQLTINQALGYAAELRLPPDTNDADRAQIVAQVIEELGLTKHADTRVEKLSGGQRKRASVALELLTGPSLLILDEPTSGLDPALDQQVMMMLRQLADAGRVVLVVTHSLTYLDVCDQVLLMAPGGKMAYLRAARSDR